MDNLNTHKGMMAQDWLDKDPGVTFHFTLAAGGRALARSKCPPIRCGETPQPPSCMECAIPVSYTHLTLPTKRIV